MKAVLLVPLLLLLKPVEVTTDATDWRTVFDAADAQVNGGAGYSAFLGNAGFPTGNLLAWSEAYLDRAYLVMYRATGDEGYLAKCRAHLRAVQANRDDRRGQRDALGALNPTWGSDRWTAGRWRFYTMNDARVLTPMLEYVALTGSDPDGFVAEAEAVMAFHDPEWRGAFWGEPPQYPGPFINEPLPPDMQASIGLVYVYLADLTGKAAYRQRAAAILAWLLHEMRRTPEGYTLWPVRNWESAYPEFRLVQDTVEWMDDVEFILRCAARGYAVPAGLPRQLAVSACQLLQNGHLALRCDGSNARVGEPEYPGASHDPDAGAYLLLAPYDGRIAGRVRRVLDGLHLPTTLIFLQEEWWGRAMLGVARSAAPSPPLRVPPPPVERDCASTQSGFRKP